MHSVRADGRQTDTRLTAGKREMDARGTLNVVHCRPCQGGIVDIDLADLAFWRKSLDERNEAFAQLRQLEHPVFFPEKKVPMLRSGKGFYALVRHADVVEASRTAKIFPSEPAVPNPEPPSWVKQVFGGPMVNMDAPRHARLRRIVT